MLALTTASSGERRTHSSEWEGTQTLRREWHAQRWPSRWGEQCWLHQQRALESGELIPQNERELRRSEGSGIAHGWPSRWGQQCWLYQQWALGSGKLIPQNEGTFRRSEGSGILIGNPLKVRGVMLALPTASSGERRTHSSEWEGTQTLRREWHAHRWPSRWGEQC